MYKRVILAYDGSNSGQQILLNLKEIEYWNTQLITLITVLPISNMEISTIEMGYMGSGVTTEVEREISQQLRKGVKSLQSMGFAAEGFLLRGETITEISRFAEKHKADLIVVGHKHENNLLKRWWSGSTAKSLVEEAPCNVLIVVHK